MNTKDLTRAELSERLRLRSESINDLANGRGWNWLPVVDLIATEGPEAIADKLLDLYFALSNGYLAAPDAIDEYTHDEMLFLQRLQAIFRAAAKPTDYISRITLEASPLDAQPDRL